MTRPRCTSSTPRWRPRAAGTPGSGDYPSRRRGPDFVGTRPAAPFSSSRGHRRQPRGRLRRPRAEGHLAFECEAFLGLCRRWRGFPKPTIAQVQGRVIAGGLMLVRPMDPIVAANDATSPIRSRRSASTVPSTVHARGRGTLG
ncbi:hypothetical protein HBB16_20095 [Pseudonocardia sp. MCCB 268]|nr:hypothetical protein [Pseudonocardia cytotoxica]